MRCALVLNGDLKTLTGGYLYDRHLLEALRSRGDEVEVLSRSRRSYGRSLADNFSARLLGRLGENSFDLLLQDELDHPSFFLLNRRIRRRTGRPIVAIVHNLRCGDPRRSPGRPISRFVERCYLRSVDGCVVNSRATLACIQALTGEDRPGRIIYPGRDHLPPDIDEEVIRRRALRPGPLQILAVANLIPGKGIHNLVRALACVPPGDWRLTVAGSLNADPLYVAALRRVIRRQGLTAHVKLAGEVPNRELVPFLKEAQVFALPSAYEGFGIAYLEAMGFGLPVIATSAGAPAEFITDGLEGFLIPPENPEVLARRLWEFVSRRDRILEMGLAARRRFLKHPTWAEGAGLLHDFLAGLAGSG